tara:strand:- start:1018 stop:2856 length:1839 start_codon:yes stop_codon:yes gene_type:complete
MPEINPTYFNFISRTLSARELQGDSGSLNLIKGDQYGDGILNTDFEIMSDRIDYDQTNGKLTISKSGAYEIIITLAIINKGAIDIDDNADQPEDQGHGFNRPDAYGSRCLIYRNNGLVYDARQGEDFEVNEEQNSAKQATFRHVLCCEKDDELRIEFQVDGDQLIMMGEGAMIVVHRLMNRFGSITLSGSTRPWKDANPLTASLLQDSPPTIAETHLNIVGYDSTHGRLISSGSDPNLKRNGGIFNISFNSIVGSASFNQTHISASINDVEFYNTKFFTPEYREGGSSRQISLIRPLNAGDYVSMFLKDKDGSITPFVTSTETPSSNTLQSGSCFTIAEVGHGNALISLSITAASASFVSGGVSRRIETSETGSYANPWNIHNGVAWDSNLISSATVTEHYPAQNITWNQGAGTFSPDLPGIYYVAALTDIRNDTSPANIERFNIKQLFVNGVTHISSAVDLEAPRTTSNLTSQKSVGEGNDFITLLSLSAGDTVSVGFLGPSGAGAGNGFKFGGGTIFTMYRLGQDWIFGESEEDVIQSDYSLKTSISSSKRDVEQPPFISMVRGPFSLRGKTRTADDDLECGSDSLPAPEAPDRDVAGVRPFCYKKISKD